MPAFQLLPSRASGFRNAAFQAAGVAVAFAVVFEFAFAFAFRSCAPGHI
jgi:hypothetical protein